MGLCRQQFGEGIAKLIEAVRPEIPPSSVPDVFFDVFPDKEAALARFEDVRAIPFILDRLGIAAPGRRHDGVATASVLRILCATIAADRGANPVSDDEQLMIGAKGTILYDLLGIGEAVDDENWLAAQTRVYAFFILYQEFDPGGEIAHDYVAWLRSAGNVERADKTYEALQWAMMPDIMSERYRGEPEG